jgi:hypothetical protein
MTRGTVNTVATACSPARELVSVPKWFFWPSSAFFAGFRRRRTGVRFTTGPCTGMAVAEPKIRISESDTLPWMDTNQLFFEEEDGRMHALIEENPMVWVVVQTQGGTETFVGQHDQDLDIVYLPFFREKEDAQKGQLMMNKEKGRQYEVQAIRCQELARDAARNGFLLFLLDEDGRILAKIDPHAA